MPVMIQCPICQRKMRTPDNVVGRQVKCPACNNTITANLAPEEVAAPAANAFTPEPNPAPARPSGVAPSHAAHAPHHVQEADYEEVVEEEEVPQRRSKRRKQESESGTVVDYLLFRKMIAPLLIQIMFWLGLAAIVVISLLAMVMPIFSGSITAILFGLVTGLLTLIFGSLGLRVLCELLMVTFNINNALADIRKNTERL